MTIDNFTSTERSRFDAIKNAFLVQQAALYGDRVAEIMTQPLLEDLARDARVFHHLVTGDCTEVDPEDRETMQRITKEVVEANKFAVRSIEFSDEARRRQLADEYLNSLKPTQRIAFERDGTLEDKTASYVAERLDARFV
ncbi:MAG: hypothetical protein AAFQ79_05250 [Pseudomonadota bacterium]